MEHIVLMMVIRMTIMVTPKVSFCHYFQLKGNACFMFFLIINLKYPNNILDNNSKHDCIAQNKCNPVFL